MAARKRKNNFRYSPPLVISVHGIQTRGTWQKRLSDFLSSIQIQSSSYDYGFAGAYKLFCKMWRERAIDSFYDYYQKVIKQNSSKINLSNYLERPSIIAHSFGSFIIGGCLLKYEDVKFDKIIFCGSILESSFPWFKVLRKDQVNVIYNEYGRKDIWAGIINNFVPETGDSGRVGFNCSCFNLIQKGFERFRHSDYFSDLHMQTYWQPILVMKPSNLSIMNSQSMDPKLLQLYCQELLRIDKAVFGHLSHYGQTAVTMWHIASWTDINPDIYTFLLDRNTNKPIGYINAMPLDDETFEKVKNGQKLDVEICGDNVVPYEDDLQINLYLMSIAVKPSERHVKGLLTEPLQRLFHGFIEKLTRYSIEHKIKIGQIVAVGWTKEGRRLCKLFGMQEIGRDKIRNPIYCLDLKDPTVCNNKICNKWLKELIDAHQINQITS